MAQSPVALTLPATRSNKRPACCTPEGSPMTAAGTTSRFGLAPPRRFILPAILLLLSERPGYGYGLVPRLKELRFGHVDRPAVYRALAQLERDDLVHVSSQSSTAGQSRRVYRVTPLGEQVLRVWMGVIKEEHDYLEQVLRRYQATGTTDAVLAEVAGGWAAALGVGWSPVSSTSANRRMPAHRDADRQTSDVSSLAPPESSAASAFGDMMSEAIPALSPSVRWCSSKCGRRSARSASAPSG